MSTSSKAHYWLVFKWLRKSLRKLDNVSNIMVPPTDKNDLSSPDSFSRGPIVFGMWSFLVIFGIFGIWSVVAPISSAAVSSGQVILDSNRKTIQHLEGGIVKEILVKEGSVVKEGDVLIKLDETAAKAKLDQLKSQYFAELAAQGRLLAERDNKETITFSEELTKQQDNPVVHDHMDSQSRLFDARRKNTQGQIEVLQQKIEQSKREIDGLEAQAKSARSQMGLLQQEISVVRKLLKDGNAAKPRLLALERQSADLDGQRGEHMALISRSQQNIGESEIQMINIKNKFMNDVMAELQETQTKINDLSERLRASQDTMNRITISSPITGTVTGLKVHTVGGVITSSEALMDIVPTDDELIIESKVQVQDIDQVHAGLLARVRLTAYKTRYVPMLEGQVKYVSADRFTEERNGMPYYIARVHIPKKALSDLPNVKLYPGMPADVLIVTGERTLLSYLFAPIRESFSKALREQ